MKNRLLIAIVFVFSTVCGHAQRDAPDTVSYGDSRYLFYPMDQDSFEYCWYRGLSWEILNPHFTVRSYLRYSCIQPVTIYGIAVVLLENGPTIRRMARDGTLSDPLEVDSSHSYAAYLAQHDGDGIFRHVDSARWHPREPDRYFRFPYKRWLDVSEWGEMSDVYDTVMPMYELYFDRPHTVLGNYYLRLRSGITTIDSSIYWWRWPVVTILTNSSYQIEWWTDDGQVFPMDGVWYGICPIIAPPTPMRFPPCPWRG